MVGPVGEVTGTDVILTETMIHIVVTERTVLLKDGK